MMLGLHIGIDLGGTNVRVGTINEKGEIKELLQNTTEAEKGYDYTKSKMVDMVRTIREGQEISGIGIGAPGPLDPKEGLILSPPNLPGWDDIPIVDDLSKVFQTNVRLSNDANAAALAEAKFGSGQGYESVFYVTVSTGVGGGLVVNGNVFEGAQGYAGEIGNMILNPYGYQQSNLNRGSLESHASGTAIGKIAEERYEISGGAEEVFRLARTGDENAAAVVNEAIDYLAMGLANITHVINPSVFVLGGGVMKSESLILPPLKEKLKSYVYPGLVPEITLKLASLGGSAGVIGAALLAE
ncbi:ROK family protein [Halobacillus salinarum]|uniref:ROK family protein n=1 Tax=Halobacillus salinarum TaxID=2932257 RepID=A0ABY4ENZ4_9BACI|nr:ROK family protein [Halobacillus salinarum]UOQ45657.1 ROK family protein [Halobacillus salinarum]